MAKRPWKYWSPTFQADTVCPMNPVWPWGGHRRFAYDLVRWMRPARVAELGVHWGTSFFTFLQAVKDGRMAATEVVGVDTFEGEDHAGHYGPEVFDTVNRIIAESFPKQQIRLHKSLFCDALPHVADESVDLLHIDGLHTYDAVSEDFETWLPKLAPEGIILFHDVAPGTGYGSSEFWKELSEPPTPRSPSTTRGVWACSSRRGIPACGSCDRSASKTRSLSTPTSLAPSGPSSRSATSPAWPTNAPRASASRAR
ncbi:MAG: class I SAM-dependent methyltransferase [Phycisphaerales bacterium]|nr:class I SAM-dependent methyltransferase [Phycisphaerales bacterium]